MASGFFGGRLDRFIAWAAVFLVVFLAGCIGGERLGDIGRDVVELSFFINETGEPLDGAVLLNGARIGSSVNGTATVAKADMGSGELTLAGADAASGTDFKFRFEVSGSDRSFGRIRLEVPLSEYGREVFDAQGIDASSVEKKIFMLANEERAKLGVAPLRLDAGIAEAARAYSEALPSEGFHHKDTAGRSVKERLAERGIIFIIASENLYFSGSLNQDTDLAKAAIDGWLASPGHRATLLDRDGLYSDAGVGVHCERKECYVVMNFASLKQEQKVSLNKGWITFYYLNNPGYNFAKDAVPVRLELSASNPVNVYVVSDRGKYEEFSAGNKPNTIGEFKGVTFLDEKFFGEVEQGIVIEAEDGNSEVAFSIDFSQSGR